MERIKRLCKKIISMKSYEISCAHGADMALGECTRVCHGLGIMPTGAVMALRECTLVCHALAAYPRWAAMA